MWPRGVSSFFSAPRAVALPPVLLLAFLQSAVPASAAETDTAEAQAFIISPLSLTRYRDMDFGEIALPSAAGTVTLTPSLVPSCTASAGLVRIGPCQPAEFVGYGAANQIVRVRLPANQAVTLTRVSGTQTMTVTNMILDGIPGFTYVSGNPASNGYVRYRIANANGVFSFRIGGRLNVAANQYPSVYRGTFSVTVDYQ
jgi:hypothetical protein